MQKKRLIGTAAALLMFIIVGFSLSAQGTSDQTEKGEPSEQSVTLTFARSNDSTLTGIEEIFNNFERETGHEVEVQVLPGGNEYETVIKTRFATNDFPDIMWYFPGTAQYDSLRAETNLANLTNEPYVEKITSSMRRFQTRDGQIYGFPWGSFDTLGVIYREDIFAQYGLSVPENYADFLSICETLRSNGITPIVEGGNDGWPLQVFSLAGWVTYVDPAIGEEGIQKLNRNAIKLTEIDALQEVFQKHIDLKTAGYLNKNWLSTTYDMQQEAIGSGEAAMVIQGQWILPALREKFGDEFISKLGMFPLPSETDRGTAALYPPGQIVIPKNTDHVDIAMELARFMTSPESLEIWYENNPGIPIYTTADSELMDPQQDMADFVAEYDSEINIQGRLRAQWPEFDRILQNVLMQEDPEYGVEELSKKYIQDGKNKKIPGFTD